MFSNSVLCRFIVTFITIFSAAREEIVAQESPAAVITIHFDQLKGPVTHNAAGSWHPFLQSAPQSTPPKELDPELFAPLGIRFIRTSIDSIPEYAKRVGSEVKLIAVLSDPWRYPGPKKNKRWSTRTPWEDWKIWDDYVAEKVKAMQAAGVRPLYDIWNEGDSPMFFTNFRGASWEKLLELYRRSFDIIRKLDPQAEITGPAIATFDRGEMKSFRDFCVKHQCVPDYWNWHFGARKIVPRVRSVQAWALNKGVMVPEYLYADVSHYPAGAL
jgi:hypothetical protein